MNAVTPVTTRGNRREVRGFCTLCRSRCGEINIVEGDRLVAVRPDPAHPTGKALCPKGRAAPEIVHSAERLTHPMRRTTPKTSADPGWRRVGWDEALDDIGRRLVAIRERHGAEAVAIAMTSASASSISDARAWLERFAFAFGTPNVCASAELCNWHKDYTHALTFGRGISTPDYEATELAVLWGHNPSHVWLAEADALGDARRRGAGLIVIDPRRTPLAAQADLWLRVRPGSDAILAMATARRLLERGGHDETFVRRWTNAPLLVRRDNGRFLRAADVWPGAEGFVAWAGAPFAYDPRQTVTEHAGEAFALEGAFHVAGVKVEPAFAAYRRALAAATLDRASAETGVAAADIEAFADRLGAVRRVCYYAWTGVGQHANATQTDRAIATLFALKGQADAPGGNVAWIAPSTNPVDDLSLLPPGQRAKALGLNERPLGPASRCWVTAGDLYRAMLHDEPYPVRALVAFGSNPLASRSEPELGRCAMEGLDLQVHCDLFENPTAATADYLLPVGAAWEREALRVGFEISAEAQRLIQLRPAVVPPLGESRPDFWIAAEIALRTGCGAALFDGDWDRACNHVLAPIGLTVAALRAAPEGMRVETPDAIGSYAANGPDGVAGFATDTRRVELYSERLLRHGQPPVPQADGPEPLSTRFPLRLTNGKAGHFCHSQHRQIAPLRRRTPAPTVALSPAAAAARGIADGDPVRIATARARIEATAAIDVHLAEEVAVGEFGWWQACDDLGAPGFPLSGSGSANYNLLTSVEVTDPVAHSPAAKSTPCEVTRVPGAPRRWTGFELLEVAALRPLTADVTLVELQRPGGGPLPPFRPGQFVTVMFEDTPGARSYSLVGAPRPAPRRYRIAVKQEPGGLISPRMAALRPGDRLLATTPAGRFTLPTRHARPIVLIAFGIGITPFMSQLAALARTGGAPLVTLHHCAPNPAAQPFRRRLLALEQRLPELTLTSWFTRLDGAPPRGSRAGRFTTAALPEALIGQHARFYLCGGPDALAETRASLTGRGVPAFEIFEERFQSPGRTALPAGAAHTIRLARSGRDLRWSGQGSILEALTQAGVDAPSGCRVGQCESCALRVLEGEVAYPEPPEDLDDGLCLTCIGVPASDLVLDA